VVCDTDRDVIRNIALDLALADPAHIGIDHDIRIALAGGLAGEPGVAIIAGTGSSCYGRRADGASWMSGCWGYFIDDLGSGWFLGQQAMAAAAQAYDGRGAATVLESRALDALGIASVAEMMHRLYVVGLSRAETAALAPLVIKAAEEGDAVSIALIDRAADELARMAQAVAAKLTFPPDVAVTALGGLALSGPTFAAPLAAALARRLPDCRIVAPILPSVLGAVLLALDEIGQAPTAEIVAALRTSA
jgi:N-acetylglucosamine kinase-like BadF-type ATPase